MWIMIINKPNTVVSPPKLSIHWAEKRPPVDTLLHTREKKKKRPQRFVFTMEDWKEYDAECEGNLNEVQRLEGMVSILFLGEILYLWPEEYSVIPTERLLEYIDESSGSHVLYEDSRIDTSVTKPVSFKDKEQRALFEAALLDGCDIKQAMCVMEGLDPDIPDIPVLGWYRAKPEYADYFCRDGEAEITDYRNKEVA